MKGFPPSQQPYHIPLDMQINPKRCKKHLHTKVTITDCLKRYTLNVFTSVTKCIQTCILWLQLMYVSSSVDCNYLVCHRAFICKTALNRDERFSTSCMYSTNMYKIRLSLNPFDTWDQVLPV